MRGWGHHEGQHHIMNQSHTCLVTCQGGTYDSDQRLLASTTIDSTTSSSTVDYGFFKEIIFGLRDDPK